MRIFACLSAKGGRLFCSNCEESLVCDICEGSGNEWYEEPARFVPPYVPPTPKLRTCTTCHGTRKARHHICARVIDVFAGDATPQLLAECLEDVRRDLAPRREVMLFAFGLNDRIPFDSEPAFAPDPDQPSVERCPWAVGELTVQPPRFDIKRTVFLDVLVSTSLRLEYMARTTHEQILRSSVNEAGASWLSVNLMATSLRDRVIVERVFRGQRAIPLP